MKTEEDEAFDDIARRQGAWGGGYQAKRQMAMDKINSDFDEEYKKMHEDRIKYGTAWSQDGKRIDPMSVYKEQPAQEPDWKEQYEYQKRRAEMWIAKYEKDIGPLEKAQPVQEPEREALKQAVEALERILGSFEKDGKVVMKSMIRNELFAEMHLLLKKAKKVLAKPAQEKNT